MNIFGLEISRPKRASEVIKERPASLPVNRKRPTLDNRAFAGGRQSINNSNDPIYSHRYFKLESPDTPDETWRIIQLDASLLNKYNVHTLIDFIIDSSPEVSKALFDFIRFCTFDWEIHVFQAGTMDEQDGELIGTPNPEGERALNEFLDLIESYDDNGIEVVLSRAFWSIFARGAFFVELVLDPSGTLPIDIAIPDPRSARFRKEKDEQRGEIRSLYQWQGGGEPVRLDRETVQYLPLDPKPDNAFGTPMVSAALFSCLFQLGVMYDLRRVVQQQGYPRLDFAVDTQMLYDIMPPSVKGDENKEKEWSTQFLNNAMDFYQNLKPDSAYFHFDTIKINRPVGTVDSSSLGAVEGLIRAIERQITRGLKTMSLLMGSNDSRSETQVKWEWQVYGLEIETVRGVVKRGLSRLFRLALEAQGIAADVGMSFGDIQTLQPGEIATPEQRQATSGEHGAGSPISATDESTQQRVKPRFTNQRVNITPEGSSDSLPALPSEVSISDAEIAQATTDWNEQMDDEYRNLLNAEVESQEDFDDEIVAVITGSWIFNQLRKTYRNRETNARISISLKVELRDVFTQNHSDIAQTLTRQLVNGDLTIQAWELEMRKQLKCVFTSEYLLAKGGRNNITTANLDTVSSLLESQYSFLHRFADQIKSGELSEAVIQNRTTQYFESATQAYERGHADSYHLTLPAHPADGSQNCKSRCKCQWGIDETETDYLCTWILNQAAEHCDSCQENARRWNPLTIAKDSLRMSIYQHLHRIGGNGHVRS